MAEVRVIASVYGDDGTLQDAERAPTTRDELAHTLRKLRRCYRHVSWAERRPDGMDVGVIIGPSARRFKSATFLFERKKRE